MNRMMLASKLAEKNKTQREMCAEIGMRPQRLSDMLSSRLQGWKYRRRISKYLGVSEEILFPDNGDKNQQSCQD